MTSLSFIILAAVEASLEVFERRERVAEMTGLPDRKAVDVASTGLEDGCK